ncbi:MAG: hypothetical protein N2663_00235 [Chlorobi bacterium]|nr:hypothetical protein [Chlorobiota bacterium]
MILVDRTIPLLPDLLAPLGKVATFDHRIFNRWLLVETKCRALFIRSTVHITYPLLEGTHVRFIGSVTSGSDHIADDIASTLGVTVALAHGANANAVAEYVLASVLLWCLQTEKSPAEHTIGIIGYGNIGRRVAEYMHHLGMHVVVCDPPLADVGFSFPNTVTVAPLDELLSTSTIVTNHVPLVTTGRYPTIYLLDTHQLRASPARLIVHTSRGGIIRTRALADAARRDIALAIDVWENEPNVSPTLVHRALIATPHIAGHSHNAKLSASVIVAQQYFTFCDAEFVLPALELPPRKRFDCDIEPNMALKMLLQSRQFDRDTDQLRRVAKLRLSSRLAAIEHFRATYPPRYEVFRTIYDE